MRDAEQPGELGRLTLTSGQPISAGSPESTVEWRAVVDGPPGSSDGATGCIGVVGPTGVPGSVRSPAEVDEQWRKTIQEVFDQAVARLMDAKCYVGACAVRDLKKELLG